MSQHNFEPSLRHMLEVLGNVDFGGTQQCIVAVSCVPVTTRVRLCKVPEVTAAGGCEYVFTGVGVAALLGEQTFAFALYL